MKNIVVIYYSGYGHTEKQAQAVFSGAQGIKDVIVKLIRIDQQGDISEEAWLDLDQADAIIFGAPTYMAMAPWQFKKMADQTSKRWAERAWQNKLAAGFTNSATVNGDKAITMAWFSHLAMQHGMIWVGLGVLPSNTLAADRNDINWLGGTVGAYAQSPSDGSSDEGPLPGDLETAKLLGSRVAELLTKIKE